jgi:hypothetical protein
VAQDLAIISDGAGQFNVLIHGLCWVHAERLVHKLLPLNDQHREDIARVRSDIWSLYADLKDYKRHATLKRKRKLQKRFDAVFTQKTRYATLNRLLRQIRLNKSELVLVRRQAIEPIIGHVKQDHGMQRCWLKGQTGDALHAVLCAAGYNLRWLLRAIIRLGLAPVFFVLAWLRCLLNLLPQTSLAPRTIV